jgi:hypothetical protein
LDKSKFEFEWTLAPTTGNTRRPVIVQANRMPAFIGTTATDFLCKSCGNVLVKGHNPRLLVSIDIECFRCKAVTRTESWPDGEPLSKGTVSLGCEDRFLISSVELNQQTAISCDEEIIRVRANCGMNPNKGSGLNISIEGLAAFETELDLLTEQQFSKNMARIRRARTRGNDKFADCVPAWAIEHLRSRLLQDRVSLNFLGLDGFAVSNLNRLRNVINTWHHNPFFKIVAKSLCSEFHHATTMMVAASYLAQHRNPIGITNTSAEAGRSPDLYVTISPTERLSVEIKAPDLLFFPKSFLEGSILEKHILNQVKSATGQLTGSVGGIVVVGACHAPEHSEKFDEAIQKIATSGRISDRIAAVSGVFHSSVPDQNDHGTTISFMNPSIFSVYKNPRYIYDIKLNV